MGLVVRSGRADRRSVLTAGFDRLLPPVCVLCSSGLPPHTPPLCSLCRSRLPSIRAPRCGRCGSTDVPPRRSDGRCPDCAEWPDDAARVVAPFQYSGSALDLVHALKYGGWTGLGRVMGELMAPCVQSLESVDAPVLVPVPISSSRMRERGFNQAELLAGAVAACTGIPVQLLLTRGRAARPQAQSGRSSRWSNVSDAFMVRGAVPRDAVGSVIIVDDVVTTGATAQACGAALEMAGFRCTGIVAFARTTRALSDSGSRGL